MDRSELVQEPKDTHNFAIIGLSRLGLFTASRLLQAGFKVTGYDRSGFQRSRVLQGYALEDDRKISAFVKRLAKEGAFVIAESLGKALEVADVVVICERAPVNSRKMVQTRMLYELADSIGKNLRKGRIVVLQTLAPPGTARTLARRCEELSGLACNKDFDFVYAPSPLVASEDFGHDIVRVVAGSSTRAVSAISEAFERAGLGKSILASSFEAAEIGVMLLHVDSCIKQALRAELSLLCAKMGVSIDEAEELFTNLQKSESKGVIGLFARNSAAVVTNLLEAARVKGVSLPMCKRARDICWLMPQSMAKAMIRNLKNRGPKYRSLTVLSLFREYDSVDRSSHPELEVVAALNRAKLQVKFSRCGEMESRRSELGVHLQPLEKALKNSLNIAILSPKIEAGKIGELKGINIIEF
jgi:UDP-N-acetyl-D-mannosaminuronate dehydrogenase